MVVRDRHAATTYRVLGERTNFRNLSDLELQELTDDELVAYITRAREIGRLDAMTLGLRVLVFGHMPNIERRVRMKMPKNEAEIDKVVGKAFFGALKGAFDGTSVGEFRSWLNRITARRIADWHRAKRIEETELPDEHPDDDRFYRDVGIVEDESDAVDVRLIIDDAYDVLSDRDKLVVDLKVFTQLSAEETTAEVNREFPDLDPPMTGSNADQIASRFRKRLRDLLDGDT